jgi:WD40 repeat protein
LPADDLVQPVSLSGGNELLCVHRRPEDALELRRWNVAARTSTPVRSLPLPGVKSVRLLAPLWAASDRWIARTGEQGSVDIWSTIDAQSPALIIPGTGKVVTHLGFAPDESRVAIGYAAGGRPTSIAVWALNDLSAPRTQIELTSPLTSIAWSPDATELAAVGEDRTIAVHEASSGWRLNSLTGHKHTLAALAYAPDGRTIASADGRTIKLWHAHTGREMLTIHRDLKIGQPIQWLEFTRNGVQLLAGDAGGRVQVFAAPPSREY